MACSALSLPFYGYFYCVCLLHIVIDNDILQRVLRSVTKNGSCIICSSLTLYKFCYMQVVHCYGWGHLVW